MDSQASQEVQGRRLRIIRAAFAPATFLLSPDIVRRPGSSPWLRQELVAGGHDAGPETIAHHLTGQVDRVPSVATVWRILKRNGLITPQPHKRPRSSFIRFEAKLPNETWQLDSTPWQLADGSPVEILNFLDDRSRVTLASTSFPTLKADDVVRVFHSASNTFDFPASLLSDNAAVFTGRSRRGKVLLELELERLGILFKHSTPYHPQTCGKVERFHQTVKRFLRMQPPAQSLAELQFQLDFFRDYYNSRRPHRALNRQTPLAVFNSLIKARPSQQAAATDHRVRRDKIDSFGHVTLRYLGRLLHIPVGTAHKNRRVRLLVAGPEAEADARGCKEVILGEAMGQAAGWDQGSAEPDGQIDVVDDPLDQLRVVDHCLRPSSQQPTQQQRVEPDEQSGREREGQDTNEQPPIAREARPLEQTSPFS